MRRALSIPCGEGSLRFEAPESKLLGCVAPALGQPLADLAAAIRSALAHPCESPPRDLARGKPSAVVIDHSTRAAPAQSEGRPRDL